MIRRRRASDGEERRLQLRGDAAGADVGEAVAGGRQRRHGGGAGRLGDALPGRPEEGSEDHGHEAGGPVREEGGSDAGLGGSAVSPRGPQDPPVHGGGPGRH